MRECDTLSVVVSLPWHAHGPECVRVWESLHVW